MRTEAIVKGRPVFQKRAWQAGARRGRRLVDDRIERKGSSRPVRVDRRSFIDKTVLDPETFVLCVAKLGDLCADFCPAHWVFVVVALHQDSVGFSNLKSHLHVAAGCVAISCCYGAPLDFIRSKEARPAETLEGR